MRLKHLKEHRPIVFSQLLLSGKLQEHLSAFNEQAEIREQNLIEQMKITESVPEEMKERDQMEWVRRMNSIAVRARENVISEIVFR